MRGPLRRTCWTETTLIVRGRRYYRNVSRSEYGVCSELWTEKPRYFISTGFGALFGVMVDFFSRTSRPLLPSIKGMSKKARGGAPGRVHAHTRSKL